MGEYRRRLADQDYNKRPTYKSVEGDEFVFYSDYGQWMIGSVPNGTRGGIKTVKSGLLHIPEKGWEYFGRVKIQEDNSLTVSYGLIDLE